MVAKGCYGDVKVLIAQLGGSMEYRPMGRGGDWVLTLNRHVLVVPVRDQRINQLDSLFDNRPLVDNPVCWDDLDDGPLKKDAKRLLLKLMKRNK